ncbi:MAG: hypothetical protein ISN28_08775 [Ectothiorhodospiraceae bacterium AqS1]|nr:hypothetical protein [Ectothiorhodospiraceae bacterium AqS1]
MPLSKILELAADIPRLIARQAIRPLRIRLLKPQTPPTSQSELAERVDQAIVHQIRAG